MTNGWGLSWVPMSVIENKTKKENKEKKIDIQCSCNKIRLHAF